MFVDDGNIVLEKQPLAGSPLAPVIPSAAPSGSIKIFSDFITGHAHQIDESGVYVDLCYPSFLRYVNWSWECDGGATATNIGGWQNSAIGSGTIALTNATITSGTPTTAQCVDSQNHPGCLSFSSSSAANSGIQCTWGTASGGMLLKAGIVFDCIFYVVSVANATYRFGFCDTSTSADAVDGAYFEIQPGGTLVAKTASNSVRTQGAASFAIPVDAWYHARVSVNSLTEVIFTLFSTTGVSLFTDTITTNIPSGSGRETLPRFIVTNSTTTATFICQLDYIGWRAPLQRGAAG